MADLTELSRVKSILDITSSNQDTTLGYFITSVSRKVEKYIGTAISETGRVEVRDIDHGGDVLTLKIAPVIGVASIYSDPTRAWSADSLIDSDDYYTDNEAGVVHFDFGLVGGPQSVQVTYTGGLGTGVTDILANGYEDLVGAVEQQVVFEYKKRDTDDLGGYSDAAGSITIAQPTAWLPHVKEVLDSYLRYV